MKKLQEFQRNRKGLPMLRKKKSTVSEGAQILDLQRFQKSYYKYVERPKEKHI